MRGICALALAVAAVTALTVSTAIAGGCHRVNTGVTLFAPAPVVVAAPVYRQQLQVVAAPVYQQFAAPVAASYATVNYGVAAQVAGVGYGQSVASVGYGQQVATVQQTVRTRSRGNAGAAAAAARARAAASRAAAKQARADRQVVRTKTVVRGKAAVAVPHVAVPSASVLVY
jgi:hypothetical protein